MPDNLKGKKIEFYNRCAELLECDYHPGAPFAFSKRTRWNNRTAGQGRFVGRGVIRRYSETLIHIQLRNPILNCVCHSEEEVIDILKNLQV